MRVSWNTFRREKTVRGGLLGATYWGWLVIEILWLDESIRGQN
jgi:hypothetical protein